MALTKRQREVFEFISGFVEANGYSPSLEEIGEHFGLSSVATVHKHVQHLVEKGMLRKAWNRSRSVEPVPETAGTRRPPVESEPPLTLRMLGTVAAGQPIEAIEDPGAAESVSVPPEMVRRPDQSYVLQVRGDSMIEDRICDGDLIVVESASEARNGETVVALVGGAEATLKRFYRKGSTVRLVPANERLEPIELPAGDVEIRGILRGLIRSY